MIWLIFLLAGGISVYPQPSELRCEYLENPLGIDVREPRLSWVVPNTVRGDIQTAYQIRVSSTADGKGDLWDSGKVMSGESIHIKYQGKPLTSGHYCYWTVETYGKDGTSHGISEMETWTMGLLEQADWKGKWIHAGGAPDKAHVWYRKKVVLDHAVDAAFAYVASHGFHELYVNGEKVDDRLMAPTLTALQKRIHYVTYDISGFLKKGENVISVWYGPGWTTFGSYREGFRGIKVQVNIDSKGRPVSIPSDSSWKWKLSSSEHVGGWGHQNSGGEKITASRLEPAWNTVGYIDRSWSNATESDLDAILVSEMIDPDRIIESIPVTQTVKKDSSYQISLAKNFTGFIEVALKGKPNTDAVIKIKDDRKDDPQGEYGEFGQTSYFTFDKKGKGVFRNRFNYMAGCEIEISGVTAKPELKAFAVSNDFKQSGSFESSNKLLNRIYETDLWTFRANTVNGVTMDCPHRERLGYGEVAFATSWGIGLPNYEAGSYYTKMIQGWMDVQHPNGNIFFVAPTPNKTWGGPLWSSAPVTLTYELYRAYADKEIIGKSYHCMKKWLDFLNLQLSEGILAAYDGGNRFLGEWSAPNGRKNNGKSPEASLFNNCVYAMILEMFVEMVDAIGNTEDVETYSARLDELRTHVHKKFFNSDSNNYINNIQTHLALPMLADVTPPEKRTAVMKNFEKEILETTPYLDMGSSGLPVLLKFLIEDAQRSDIIYTHLNKTTHPSYGYFLSRGETTWPEYWSSDKASKIHTCYTGIASFFLKGILGIQNEASAVGFKHFQVKPGVFGDLAWASGSAVSMYGTISTDWKKEDGGRFTLNVNVPGNTTAELYLPKPEEADSKWAIHEQAGICWKSGTFVAGVPGIIGAKEDGDFIVLHVGCGEYRFEAGIVR
jgi:alpha-L-rhamnosidase